MPAVDHTRGLRMNSSLLAIQAAIDGQGVTLARSIIVEDDVKAGRLVRPFDSVDATRCAYYVVYPKQTDNATKVKVLRDWLLEQAALRAPTPPSEQSSSRRVSPQRALAAPSNEVFLTRVFRKSRLSPRAVGRLLCCTQRRSPALHRSN
jgi:hypothetical protein